jgi:uncharacterized protein (TIGR03118 family)
MNAIRRSQSALLRAVRYPLSLLLFPLLAGFIPTAHAGFIVTNLVTNDQTAHPAQVADPNLVNAWGVAYSPTSPFWVSNNGSGTSTLYSVNPATDAVAIVPLVVTIPNAGNPTGMAFNPGAAGGAFNSDAFLFVSEDGTVSGWRGALGTMAETLEPPSSDVYKGATTVVVGGHTYLLTTNFTGGDIDAEKGDAGAPDLAGNFTDPGLPSGYSPFGIANLGGAIYVTYAFREDGNHDETAGPGLGIVSVFDTSGNFIARFATGGSLNAPWGLAIAPASFGQFAGDLLVGNFGDGRISAFDIATHAFEGLLNDTSGNPLSIDGLWALIPGNNGGAGSSSRIYFSAGPDGESNGLFGVLAVPEPATAWLGLFGLVALARARRTRTH